MSYNFDPRIRIIVLILLTVAYSLATLRFIPAITIITLFICILFYDVIIREFKVISMTLLILGLFILLVWAITNEITFHEATMGYLRLASIITISILIFSSLTTIELITSLTYFKLPTMIALAVGIGLRFLPVFIDEAKRIFYIQSRRDINFSINSIKKFGILGLLSRIISPLLVSILRRIDSISLSITVQQIENRIVNYNFAKIKYYEWVSLLFCIMLLCYVIFFEKNQL